MQTLLQEPEKVEIYWSKLWGSFAGKDVGTTVLLKSPKHYMWYTLHSEVKTLHRVVTKFRMAGSQNPYVKGMSNLVFADFNLANFASRTWACTA